MLNIPLLAFFWAETGAVRRRSAIFFKISAALAFVAACSGLGYSTYTFGIWSIDLRALGVWSPEAVVDAAAAFFCAALRSFYLYRLASFFEFSVALTSSPFGPFFSCSAF